MPKYSYERLSDHDQHLLASERPGLPLQAGLLQVFDGRSLLNEFGGIQFQKLRRAVASALHHVPRYRQCLASIPYDENLVWVDDASFQLDFHLRQTSLPRPGTELQLKRLMGRIMAQPLDRARPLWELWVVEGLSGDRFAIIFKAHLCMVESVAGVDLMEKLFAFTEDETIPEAPPFHPRPLPTGGELWRGEWGRRSSESLQAIGEFGATVLHGGTDLREGIARGAQALREVSAWKIASQEENPLNGPVGPHRLFDSVQLSLTEMKEVRRALGCSINDLILAVLTGAIRQYMRAHQVRPEDIGDFLVEVPLALQSDLDGQHRNVSMTLPLPLAETDPRKWIDEIRQAPREPGGLRPAENTQLLQGVFDLLSLRVHPPSVNMVVSNSAGLQTPLHLLGAELLEAYPVVPLYENLGLCVGVFSYNGQVYWGLDADYDRVPDLDSFAAGIRSSFGKLAEIAREQPARPSSKKRKTRASAASSKKRTKRSRSSSTRSGKKPQPPGPRP